MQIRLTMSLLAFVSMMMQLAILFLLFMPMSSCHSSLEKYKFIRRQLQHNDEDDHDEDDHLFTLLKGKKGIGMATRPDNVTALDAAIARIEYLQPYWHYNWNRILPNAARMTNVEYIPMMYGCYNDGDPNYSETVASDLRPDIENGNVKLVLGYNEPDHKDQANIPVSLAVQCWPALQETGVLLGAPVVSNNTGDWLPTWRQAATEWGLRTDYTTVHWHALPSFPVFRKQMRQVYRDNGRKPLLITEFAPADWSAMNSIATNLFTQEDVLHFMKQALPWLERKAWVAGYAWFSFPADHAAGHCSALFDVDGQPTVLGQYYASVRYDNPNCD